MPGASGGRIVISYNTCWYIWNFRMPLIAALRQRGYEVVALAPRDEYTRRIVSAGVTYRSIHIDPRGTNPVRELAALLAFIRIYRRLKPVAVLQYTIKPNLYGSIAARVLGISAVNNVTGLGAAFESTGPFRGVIEALYRFAFRRVEQIFFQNPDDLRLFVQRRLVAPRHAALLPGSGVDLAHFSPRPRGAGGFTFLFIGRLLKAKGVEELVAAAHIVRARLPGTRIVLLGKRDDDDPRSADPRILDAAASVGTIELAGTVDDVRPSIAAADCVVLPSYYREGIPRSLLEAAAMGRPLIAADSIGTREPVRNGANGYHCRPRDHRDLADKMVAMAELSEGARIAMGTASRRIAEDRFDERIVIAKYLQTIDRLVGKAR